MRLQLIEIIHNADFRKTELTLYEQYRRSKRFLRDPNGKYVYLFVSRQQNQLIWVLNYESEVLVSRTTRRRIESIKMRISGGMWNPSMLADYAEQVGIQLIGIKKFEQIYNEFRKKVYRKTK